MLDLVVNDRQAQIKLGAPNGHRHQMWQLPVRWAEKMFEECTFNFQFFGILTSGKLQSSPILTLLRMKEKPQTNVPKISFENLETQGTTNGFFRRPSERSKIHFHHMSCDVQKNVLNRHGSWTQI